jgi:prepilin-type N-terminal cleavage/methylation domain-containing protein
MNKEKGFTLTETMVVVVVFAGVMSLSLAVFLGSIRAQRFALYQQRLVTESSFAMKKIEDGIRDGEITKDNIANYESKIENEYTSSGIKVKNYRTNTTRDDMITVFLETEIKLDEERNIILKLQTTAKKR